MGIYAYLREFWKKPDPAVLRQYMISWRKDPSVIKIERPLRLDRARSLGYKAKEGILVARVRVPRGGRKREAFKGGRRSRNRGRKKIVAKSYQWIAEERANQKFHNFEVLNSYLVAKDGIYAWYEVLLIDPNHPAIRNDKHLGWVQFMKHKGRVYRGKTASGRRSRGLLTNKGKGAEKLRPSLRAHGSKAH